MTDAVPAQLSAGLDAAEQAAREVLAFEEQYHKLRDKGISVTIRYEWVRHTKLSTGGRGSMFFGGAPTPRDVVRGAEAIRKVLAVCDAIDAAALDGEWWEGSKYGGRADDIREALAGIYTEPTQESTADGSLADVPDAELHRRFAHPAYQYETTEGQRKCWDAVDEPPEGEGWERNVDAGRDGWERFDYTEESYWRRLRDRPEPTDTEGN